jgi:transposase
VPANHPLRQIRALVREVLKDLSRTFGKLYASEGRPSIPPEQLVSALLLQACYGIRSERQFIAGLSVFRPMIAYGTRRPSRRIATGCSKATCFKNS